ncbi:glycerol kinase GlpK [Fervidobacterium nodosum]|uniref:ATP:glycerol 3-phosphotransferase n=1 Tax=Fervidobacterium nodosum (strain ATCC 35602 / DSM 5306 / Rt17-B1) TaxID=381764 RepID=A7HK41_FERNB|nr:glycerol kinase GlpK [Fervidobacterium nodosum]ABS60274.1 glycerol kinase [Fervidobacterium nodosum Rt17-B1]PHJ14353.1 carbohydrate kinase [Fervidobacterium sp. SC_NGM5_G05]
MYIGLDQGTTSTRAILFDENFNMLHEARREFKQIYPKEGWVEHNPEEIWQTVVEVLEECKRVAESKGEKIKAIGITNQRETIVAWDEEEKRTLYNAIVWQCRRTAERSSELRKDFGKVIKDKTGLVVDPYFSATKIEWLLNNVEEVKRAATKGTLRFGTIDSYLAWKLTGQHVTDYSNASRTMLFNIHTLDWDNELLELFGVKREFLPKLVDTAQYIGDTKDGIPVSSLVGDQQSALFGQTAFEKGDVKCTLGTGSFILMNTGDQIINSQHNLLSTVGWKIGNEIVYALEGSVFITGTLVNYLIRNLGFAKDSAELTELALQVGNNGGIYFVPAFTGLGAPYWDPYARGLIIGLTPGTDKRHIIYAAFEGIAFSVGQLVALMEKESEIYIKTLKVDGGVSKNNLIMQILSNTVNTVVERPVNRETTALGAATLAAIAMGWVDKNKLKEIRKIDRIFTPKENREEEFNKWKQAVNRALNWES